MKKWSPGLNWEQLLVAWRIPRKAERSRFYRAFASLFMDIKVEGISKTYAAGNKALDQVTFDFNLNGIFSLIGKNGAGKTTLIRILSTQLLPTSGRASVNGMDVVDQAREIRELVAAVPQEARAVPWMTPIQTLTSYLMWRGYTHSRSMNMGKDVLRMLGMEKQENTKNRNLSGGQKRKVLVATALASEATLIFMDEPTTGLDFISRKELWEVLVSMKRNRLIVLTTHYLEEAEELGDLIGIMNAGSMVGFGTLDQLRGRVKFPLGIKIFSQSYSVPESIGDVELLSKNEVQVYTTEDGAYALVNDLLSKHIKFTVQEISLNTIFESVVNGSESDE
ncbi:putative ABC transporter ATP-binding protein [Thermoplasmatales archaeon]|nr:putative ABC transporter ATP-binding protein [Thermoplasmatales archaeon]